MRNTKSLIEDDDAMGGGLAFIMIGIPAVIVGFIEGKLLTISSLCLPALSSLTGGTIGSICTWLANIITA